MNTCIFHNIPICYFYIVHGVVKVDTLCEMSRCGWWNEEVGGLHLCTLHNVSTFPISRKIYFHNDRDQYSNWIDFATPQLEVHMISFPHFILPKIRVPSSSSFSCYPFLSCPVSGPYPFSSFPLSFYPFSSLPTSCYPLSSSFYNLLWPITFFFLLLPTHPLLPYL